MDILEIIDILEDAIDGSTRIPLIGKSLVDKEELLDLIKEVRLQLPEDLKQAKWIKEERQRILTDAEKESERVIRSAKEQTIMLIDDHQITKMATEKAQQMFETTKQEMALLRSQTKDYVNDTLSDVEDRLVKVVSQIRDGKTSIK